MDWDRPIGYLRQAEKERLKYKWELEWFCDSLYELLSMQEPSVGRIAMDAINDYLYSNTKDDATWDVWVNE